MIRRTLLIFGLSLFPLSLQADEPPRWIILPEKTHVEFAAVNAGKNVTGNFSQVTGEVKFAPDRMEQNKAHIEIAMKAIKTADGDVASSLPLPEWLDVKKYATATFDSASFDKLDAHTFTAMGTLKLKGIARPLILTFTLDKFEPKPGGIAEISGKAYIKRLDFGIGQGEWKSISAVADEVTLTIHAVATYAALR